MSDNNFSNDKEFAGLELSLDELIYIDDCLTMSFSSENFSGATTIRFPEKTNCVIASKSLIDKIGNGLWLAKKYTKAKINIVVTEYDLYVLRELALSHIESNGKKVGLSIKNKIIDILFTPKKEDKNENKMKKLIDDIEFDGMNNPKERDE